MLSTARNREHRLGNLLSTIDGTYDWILIDCPGTTALFGLPNTLLGVTLPINPALPGTLPALGGAGNVVTNILLPTSTPNMQLIDARYFVQLT